MRGRPKSFDRDQALEQAIVLFWEKGYTATGISDLTSHMGIGRQSLYDTFGGKHELFLEALRRYVDRRVREARETLQAPGSPMANLQTFFGMWREEALTGTCGCMIVNSTTEIGAADDQAARLVERAMGRLEQLFRETLERARDAGELADIASPRALARLIIAVANGMAARSRLGLDEEELDDVLAALTGILGAHSARPPA
ncbi:MAG: TetR/AcrR family transcriptional regulator [Acidobacteriota bacterium]